MQNSSSMLWNIDWPHMPRRKRFALSFLRNTFYSSCMSLFFGACAGNAEVHLQAEWQGEHRGPQDVACRIQTVLLLLSAPKNLCVWCITIGRNAPFPRSCYRAAACAINAIMESMSVHHLTLEKFQMSLCSKKTKQKSKTERIVPLVPTGWH